MSVALRRRAVSGTVFFTNFAAAKLATYLTPLLIAAVASKEVFGGIEFAQSVGLVLAAVLASTPLNGMTQLFLVSRRGSLDDIASALTVAGCAAGLIATVLAFLFGAGSLAVLTAAAFASAVAQNTVASVYRTLARRNVTAWSDGLAILVSGIVVLGQIGVTGRSSVEGVATGYLVVTALMLTLAVGVLVRTRRPRLRQRLIEAARTGLPMMVVGVLAIWLGVGGRLIIGFFNTSGLAAYGVAFRVAGLALGIHQLAMTALFARLYAARTRAADTMLAAFLAAVAAACALLAVAGPFLPSVVRFKALAGADVAIYRAIVPVVALQVFLWIGYAMTQLRVNRNRLAGRAVAPTLWVTVLGVAGIAGVAEAITNDTSVLCWLLAVHSAAYALVNLSILSRRGLPHRRVALTTAAGGAGLALLALVLPPLVG